MLQPMPHSVTLTDLLLPRDDALSSLQSIMLIQCSRCGSEIERSAVVCVHCGGGLLQPAVALVSAPATVSYSGPEYIPSAFDAPAPFTSTIEASNSQYEGIGGWLILVAINRVLGPLILLYALLHTYLPLLINPRAQSYLQTHGALHALLLFEAITILILFLIDIWLDYLFFTKRRAFPTFMICFLVFQCIYVFIDHFTAIALMSKSSSSNTLVSTLLAAAIWIPYYLRSRRVKVTFVH